MYKFFNSSINYKALRKSSSTVIRRKHDLIWYSSNIPAFKKCNHTQYGTVCFNHVKRFCKLTDALSLDREITKAQPHSTNIVKSALGLDRFTPASLKEEGPVEEYQKSEFRKLYEVLYQEDLTQVDQMLRQLVNGGKLQNDKLSNSFFGKLFSVLSNSEKISPVHHRELIDKYWEVLLQYADPPTSHTISAIIYGFFRRGDFPSMETWFSKYYEYNLKPESNAWSWMLQVAAENLNKEKIDHYLSLIPPGDMHISSMNVILAALHKKGDTQAFNHYFTKLSQMNVPIDRFTITVLLQHMEKSGERIISTIALWDEVKAAEIQIDSELVTQFIKILAKEDNLDLAIKLFEEARFLVTPDVVMFGVLIDVLGKARRLALMSKYFDLMLKHNIKPSLVIFGSMIHAFGLAGDMNAMVKTFETMYYDHHILPHRGIYGSIIKACKQHGDTNTEKRFRVLSKQLRTEETSDLD